MRLEKPGPRDDNYRLAMSLVEWKEVYALAQFAQAGIAYDAQAPYVAQVFIYVTSQPKDVLGNRNTRAAFAAVDRLAAEGSADAAAGVVILRLPKEEIRQLLVMLGMAAESEDQADIIHDGEPDKFPHGFPAKEIEIAASHYAEAFDNLMAALHEDRTLNIDRPVYQRLTNG